MVIHFKYSSGYMSIPNPLTILSPHLFPLVTISSFSKSVSLAALLTTAKTWKQPKCPSTEEWIKKMWYTYTMEYYSAIKKNEIMPFAATWMDLEIAILSELSQT